MWLILDTRHNYTYVGHVSVGVSCIPESEGNHRSSDSNENPVRFSNIDFKETKTVCIILTILKKNFGNRTYPNAALPSVVNAELSNFTGSSGKPSCLLQNRNRRYMAEILPIRRKTRSNQSIRTNRPGRPFHCTEICALLSFFLPENLQNLTVHLKRTILQ